MADHRMQDSPTYARSTQSDEEKLDPISVLTKAVLDLQNEIKILKQERDHPVDHPTVDLHKRGGQKSTVVCHYCKREGNVKPKCFKYLKSLDKTKSSDQRPSKNGLPKSKKPNTKGSVGRSGVTYKVGEAGMFFHALVNGKVVKLLVDSGATMSILSPDVLNSVGFGNLQLVRLSRPIVTANGSPLKTDGLLTTNMQLGSDNFAQAFAVAEIGVDGILGLDFLKDYHCFIDMESLSPKVGGKRHALHMEDKIGC